MDCLIYYLQLPGEAPFNPNPLLTKAVYNQLNPFIIDEDVLTDWMTLHYSFDDAEPNQFPIDGANLQSVSFGFTTYEPNCVMDVKSFGYYRDVPLQDTSRFDIDKLIATTQPTSVPTISPSEFNISLTDAPTTTPTSVPTDTPINQPSNAPIDPTLLPTMNITDQPGQAANDPTRQQLEQALDLLLY